VIHVFDTNVLSEAMRDEPHPSVVAWLRDCPADTMFTTAISRAEILYGIRRLAEGGKRRRLERAAQAMFGQEFRDRVLPFDAAAADFYAELRVLRARGGRPIATEDAMIAAVARVHGATVVTRDVGGFAGCGLVVVDPWAAG
jgi:predicted nucleic acid-binding protein